MRIFCLYLIGSLSFGIGAQPYQLAFDNIDVTMAKSKYKLEYARTGEQRRMGLMYRNFLCADCGMVFAFSPPQKARIWMKNTFIPLSVAFVDEQGIISDIFELTPHNLVPVESSRPVSHAIEMNKGWFSRHNIKVGDTIQISASN